MLSFEMSTRDAQADMAGWLAGPDVTVCGWGAAITDARSCKAAAWLTLMHAGSCPDQEGGRDVTRGKARRSGCFAFREARGTGQ